MKSWSIVILFCSFFIELYGASYLPEECIKHAQSLPDKKSLEVDRLLFVPTDEVKKTLLGLIHAEQKSIQASLFRLTDKDVTQALILAHKRGVKVVVLVDKSAFGAPCQKVSCLVEAGIPVKSFEGKSFTILHHKYFIFERTIYNLRLVWFGSANATETGLTKNRESVNIRSKKSVIESYQRQFYCEWCLPQVKLHRSSLKSDSAYYRLKAVAVKLKKCLK